MPVRIGAGIRLVVSSWCLVAAALAAPVTGVDADREEARINREFKRAEYADAYLAAIAERVVAAAPARPASPVRIRAVQDPDPFIFCLGNGAAYVSTGLLARLQNDSQLATLLAPELSAALAPDSTLEDEYAARNRRSAGPKILAVIATAGLAVFPMMKSENKAYSEHVDTVIFENDKIGLDWARRAGFDVTQGAAAPQRLAQVLEAEGSSGFGRLANDTGLKNRGAQLARAAGALPADATIATHPAAPDPLRSLSRRISFELASDLGPTKASTFTAMLDRIEREYGVSGESACMRARFMRQQPASAQIADQVIEAYRACTAAPDAPAEYFRELAFLHRDRGDSAAALKDFELYLARDPHAVDAPIVKGYIEELRAKH